MKSENEYVEKRINSLLAQLQSELAILDKIVYKGKNQHRRAFYFQYLLKVRRDLKLLQSANLKKILNFLFQIINKEKSNSCTKRRKLNIEEHQFQKRLLGVARLLSQMVEPIVKAAIEFSSLLARSFFMGFSLANLALLARLRVLVQQILLDVVSVFNISSSFWQWGQSTVLNFGGVEVVREYHPSDNDVTALECVWETDKFVLLEKTNKSKTTDQVKNVAGGTETPLKSFNIKYQTIEAFLGDDELACQTKGADYSLEDLSGPSEDRSHTTDASANQLTEINNEKEVGDNDDEGQGGSPEKSFVEGGINASMSPFSSQKLQTESRRKVAFVSVGHSTPSQMKESGSSKKEVTANCLATSEKEDSFFNLLAAGHTKDSFF